jgi:hypothetical protein
MQGELSERWFQVKLRDSAKLAGFGRLGFQCHAEP